MNKLYSTCISLLVMASAAWSPAAYAFAPSTYAGHSLMASGTWVKISVPSTGLYKVTAADLRKLGFNDPSAVRVMGYGGQTISDILILDNYTDDIYPAPQESTASGIVFYALGPEKWTTSTSSSSLGMTTHALNPYSTHAFYFLTDAGESPVMAKDGTAEFSDLAADTYMCPIFHETDLTSPGESGFFLAGEDFRSTRTRSFTFALTDAAADSVAVQVRFVTKTSSTSRLAISANGTEQYSNLYLNASNSSVYGTLTTINRYIKTGGSATLSLGLTFTPSGEVSMAALDAIDINYLRHIRLHQGSLCFSSSPTWTVLAGATADTRVWDVTNPAAPLILNTAHDAASSTLGWKNAFGGMRKYAAWNESASLPSPEIIGRVNNQDIHGSETPDMFIITPEAWRSQAERIAELHRNSSDSLRVMVVSDQQAFNEFSSGTPDVGAFRRMFKMMYDRGTDSTGHSLRYALMLGRTTHDPRQLTQAVRSLNETILVGWSTDEGLRESDSYCTDDILAQLADGAGRRMPTDLYCIAVGRIPAGTIGEVTSFVDKLTHYMTAQDQGAWKNRVVLVADDGDNGVHGNQTELAEKHMRSTPSGNNMVYEKVYVDAYDEVGGVSVIGRERLHRSLEEGTALWHYVGHANKQVMGSERLITYNDLSTVKWNRNPFLYAATCSFLRWDGSEKSGGEILFHNKRGIIGALCPTREVYISENEYMTNAFAAAAWGRDSLGMLPTVGDMYMNSKNNVRNTTGSLSYSANKLRFVLMADPAMRLVTPSMQIRVDSINGEASGPDWQPTLMARQNVNISGTLLDARGTTPLSDFSGTLTAVLYDAEHSVVTKGRPSDDTQGKPITFEEQGQMLFTGCSTVNGGKFSLNFAMPEDIADNFRPAALNLYAVSPDGREAISCFRNLYVYGYDETAEPDTIAPVIDYAYLNHSTFADGDFTNSSPMFIAAVSDNTGINLSSAGVGHRMTLRLDGSESHADVSSYYQPLPDGSVGGTIAYPMSNITPGPHTLAFRVWDTSGNSSTHTLSFNVSDRIAPKLFEVYTDANPASTHANFYLSHNRPDAEITATIEVFAINGRRVWSSTVTDRSDMFTSAPIRWDLCDEGGHRVNRGIYLYRASVTCDGQTSASETRRLAVTGK